jgi:futalosine hydrolase
MMRGVDDCASSNPGAGGCFMTQVDLLILIPTAGEARGLCGAAPVGLEVVRAPELADCPPIALVGFGLAAAGAMAAAHLARLQPRRCVLAGLAGSLNEERAPIGAVIAGHRVTADGIGIGFGDDHVSAENLGFWQAPGLAGRALTLQVPKALPAGVRRGALVSVAAGSPSADVAGQVHVRHPDTLAEDMETWSVALACRAFGVPLTVLRAVCNVAGERDKKSWRIGEAFARGRESLQAVLRAEESADSAFAY